jgi:hypothetical protein
VRALLPERRLGLLPDGESAAVDEHAKGCPSCALERSFERDLAAGLASLRESRPLPIDVSARVMLALEAEPVPRPARTRRRLLLAAAAAIVPLILLVALALPQGPSLAEVAILAKHAVVALGLGISRALALVAPLGKIVAAFAGVLADVGVVLQALAPAAQVATAICLASMALVTVTVLGRDWMRPSLARKEIE